MVNASIAKLNQYSGDIVFDRVREEFEAAQEEGISSLELDIKNLDDEIRMDFMFALSTLGYEVEYKDDDSILEVWSE